jgi:LmbE family N-acetylglucosaminyl deacetylase
MGTLVCLHAHPDDESIATGGTIARAVAEGHRVVLVMATGGEYGEAPADLAEGETLRDRRRAETERSAAVLGVDRLEWLGYHDSGMTGWEQNSLPGSFIGADVDEAAGRLAAILRAVDADLLTTYDWHGNYGHPDHIQVHRVGMRAAELTGVRVVQATMNRDAMRVMAAQAREAGADEFDPDGPADDGNPMGTPAAEITYAVDVTPWVLRKRESIRCHASQITDSGFFSQMPDDVFAFAFGTEYFIDPAQGGPVRDGWLFE